MDDYYFDEEYAEYAYISREMYKEILNLYSLAEINSENVVKHINEVFKQAVKKGKEKNYKWLKEAIYEKLVWLIEEYVDIEKGYTDTIIIEQEIMNNLKTVEDIEAGLYRLYKSAIPEEDYNARLLAEESKKESLQLELGHQYQETSIENIVNEFIKDMQN